MGNFTDRVRNAFNPNKQKQIELNRALGLKDDARMVPMEKMHKPHDAYFIRVVGQPNTFVKFLNGEYFTQEGPEMACLWDLKTGTDYIKNVVEPELELVRLDAVIKHP